MLLPAFLEPCLAAPAPYQNQTPTANPLLASGPILTLGPKVSQGQINKEVERRSRTKRHIPPAPLQPATAHQEAKEIWCAGERAVPLQDGSCRSNSKVEPWPAQLSPPKPNTHLAQEAPSGTGVEVNGMG